MRISIWRRLRAVATALVFGGALLVGPLSAPSPVLGVGPLPACRVADILTIPRGYDDWSTTLVDLLLTVGPDYKPPDLVSVRKAGVGGGGYVRALVIPDLTAMEKAAAKHGTPLVAFSPYRSYSQQQELFNIYAGWNSKTQTYSNYKDALTFSQRPGHSEHQLGLVIDFIGVGDKGLTSNWEVTRTGGWMAKNAWKYGWVMSYPKGVDDKICFSYEPWHYRYYGRDLAKKIHDSGLTPREYLWANFTQLDSSGNPVATATIAPTTAPTLPAASPTTEPSIPAAGSPEPTASTSPAVSASVESTLVFAIILIALAAIGLVASVRFLRRQQRIQRRR